MEKIILVSRPTRLDSLVAKFNTRQQAKFYVEHLGSDFSDYENEHEKYYKALSVLERIAERQGKVLRLDWKYLPNFLFGEKDLILTIGQDGLVANTLKYLDRQRIIGFNPDPSRWDGVLSQFSVSEAADAISETLKERTRVKEITRAKITLSDRQELYAVNDFFIGIKSHCSARYSIRCGSSSENQSSSGVIVSTPLGRSGWMKSIIAGSSGITESLNGDISSTEDIEADWSDDELLYAVREPFPSVCTGTEMVFGRIGRNTNFEIESHMGENGVVFSDGVQEDFLDFNYSIVASVSIDEVKGRLVVKQQA